MASVVGGSAALFKAPHEQVAHHGNPAASPLGLASATFSGMPAHSGAVATHTHEGGNTVVHLHDGSTLTVVGTSHIDASFLHHS
jgi:ferric-dicitrate binding protein FerR (iron transport regulator)